MSFVSALPANLLKFSYVVTAVSITVSDTASGKEVTVSIGVVTSDSGTLRDAVAELARQVLDFGSGSGVSALAVMLSSGDVASAVGKAVLTTIKLLKRTDSGLGIDVRDRGGECVTIANTLICYVRDGDVIEPEDHNLKAVILGAFLDRLKAVKNKLDEAGGYGG